MFTSEVLRNILLTILCYCYVLLMIYAAGNITKWFGISQKNSRKFLHAMIGNLPFVIPFFTSTIFPVIIAAPFIIITYLASPYSPLKSARRMRGLVDLTEKGHSLGLVFYAISYTLLALLFASKPIVIAAGILPMAYGDSVASIVGTKHGRIKYRLLANKSLEGSIAMFVVSFSSFAISVLFFSTLYSFSVFEKILSALPTAIVATVVEAVSPMGFDNLSVPAFSVSTFLLVNGGI